jgi:XTP/dITP diphosphohydrolase
MKTRILIGSGNAKKKAEILHLLRDLDVALLAPSDLSPMPPPPPETGTTFEANAAEKGLAYAASTGLLVIADDSGLEVDALDGRPGVHSARYAGPDAKDADNNARLLAEMRGVPSERRTARYVSVVTLVLGDRVLLQTRGTCEGRILDSPVGAGGFGYDPLFCVPALGRTFAEITAEEKGAISHRGKALEELRARLPAVLAEITQR